MKSCPHISKLLPRRGETGFTLAEMMVSTSIFLFIFVGTMVAIQIFGMRVVTLAQTKLVATTGARQTLNAMRDSIRAATFVYVGTYNPTNGSTFAQVPINNLQMGNALEIVYTNQASTNYLVYYQDSTQPTNLMCSITNNVVTVLAQYVTNYYCFYAEDYQTNILLNYQNNPVIHVIMNFSQWEYPMAFVGTNGVNAYDFYRLQTRISRRSK
jgi:type II secretory pathway pseudopilin PulG